MDNASNITPEVLWAGHLYDYTGYGKSNRAILFRLENHVKVRLDATHKEPCYADRASCERLDSMKNTIVGDRAPFVRFFGPDYGTPSGRYRIVWTMMETYKIHPNMIDLVNRNFDELWTPTEWNRQVFVESGVTIKTRTIPLGVDPAVYAQGSRHHLPKCRLISTAMAGLEAIPQGYMVLSVGLPSFRKGFDVIADAMEIAFGNRKDVGFIINVTWSPRAWKDRVYQQFAKYNFPIWSLEGTFNEQEMASIYSSCDVYVSASRGEGWNLPACEAAACGLPVVCPDNTCHGEVFGNDAYLFKHEGISPAISCNGISPWYNGMPFSVLGKKSTESLASILKYVYEGGEGVKERAARLSYRIRSMWTWDRSAAMVIEELEKH